MAESESSSWWGTWVKAAKEKSAEVLVSVKRDLDEFSSAVRCEAGNVVTSTSTVFRDTLKLDEPDSTASTVKRSVSSFFGQVSSALNPEPDDEDQEAVVIFDNEPVPLSPLQAKIHALTLTESTFLTDPPEAQTAQYQAWLSVVEDQLSEERLSRKLSKSPNLAKMYQDLVPSQVSHRDFWRRFLFQKALLEDEEARKEAMARRADREKKRVENFAWDKMANDLDFNSTAEISEEEQIRLLNEYQKEMEVEKEQQQELATKDNHYAENTVNPIVNEKERESSNEDDWECEFDLEEVEPPFTSQDSTKEIESKDNNITNNNKKGNDSPP